MLYKDIINGMKRFGSSEEDMCLSTIGVSRKNIRENVIVAPTWSPSKITTLGTSIMLSKGENPPIEVWDIDHKGNKTTYIRTGIGAGIVMDIILALGLTGCKKIIFIGSVGAITPDINIGDIVIPEYSVCGDGASKYIDNLLLKDSNAFGVKAYPDVQLTEKVLRYAKKLLNLYDIKCHIGRNFSVDSIFAEFCHLDEIIGMGCNTIEMETAAAFKAAAVIKRQIAAIFCVSDNSISNKSLISNINNDEVEYRRKIRCEVIPKIIHGVLE